MLGKAEQSLKIEKKNLENFILAWEEAEAKRRKKKLRIARVEKTDEEIAFESGERWWLSVIGSKVCVWEGEEESYIE